MTDTDLIATPVLDTTDSSAGAQATDPAQTAPRAGRRGAGLSGMVLAELRTLAAELGIKGTSGMRKGDLIAAIKERQSGGAAEPAPAPEQPARTARTRRARGAAQDAAGADTAASADTAAPAAESAQAQPAATTSPERPAAAEQPAEGEAEGGRRGRQRRGRRGGDQAAETATTEAPKDAAEARADEKPRAEEKTEEKAEPSDGGRRERGQRDGQRDQRDGQRDQRDGQRDQGERRREDRGQGPRQDGRDGRGGDDDEDGRGRRGRRFRERRRGRDRGEAGGDTREPEIREDDVLQPVAGILDVLDNYAFVRTSGYLAGPNDVYVSMNMVRKNGLRRGDAITGAVRVPREGEQGNQRQKFNPLVRLDTVNGGDVEAAKRRPEFNKLTPLYPNQRLRLETTPNILTTRVIDLIMPIGKGQRALIVSPPKAGKTTVMQDIANAITTNNPECYLMVVLVDERPEEVTDMQRSVKGEVIASTFDRPPSDHTSVAELAIERAKRLVEQGRDVVVLLDSITRLGRAYNNSSPASGRILSGGVDSTALYPPKRFLGAARNIENGGSLTIIATAMVETGSTGDTVIFEEFKGTGNAELKLDRKIAERRVFPAVDVNPSGTRKDELLMSPDEFAVVHKLRRVLSGLDSHQAIDLLIDRLKKSKSNIEFLLQVSKTAPGALDD
ncbi:MULTISPECIES: transcription termination factor Rho [Rhodococcus]|uniref:transcription termination factor Rho n=1 Tax=Rhodococcus TaxID=1827 RepID=UPI00034ADD7C|nr:MULTISPECIES: transcription termination factor Rho [Rhodococcus]AUM15767.1 transcription termination factor Rho [Rhodococcus ruber]AWG98621.1 transcription termination factor Rho [Rhodococcus ruber]MBD8054820.1 transcription termination factor Rho [Rhodococcus ruber]MDO1482175.1 transcription termination factor Rho [Rhodococcus ruber]